eukprot:12728621-Ditylum_brightwellii.AAC.1
MYRFLLQYFTPFWVFPWIAPFSGAFSSYSIPYSSHVKTLFTPPFLGVSVANFPKVALIPCTPPQGLPAKSAIRQ